MNLRLIKTFTGLVFDVKDVVVPDEEEDSKDDEDQSQPSDEDGSDADSDDGERMQEEKIDKKKRRKGDQEDDEDSQMSFVDGDKIQKEIKKIKPRLALFRVVGIGLKNNNREMA